MLPTSIPLRRTSGEPQVGQASPSIALSMSATTSGVKSRPALTLRMCQPTRFAPATRFGESAASVSTTIVVPDAPIGEP